MAKKLDNTIFDAALNVIKTTGATLTFCSAEPANYAGIAAVTLIASGALTGADYTGPADGTVSGRKLTVNAINDLAPSANGTVIYACIDDGVTLLAGTSVTSQAVLTTEVWDFPAIEIEITDPV